MPTNPNNQTNGAKAVPARHQLDPLDPDLEGVAAVEAVLEATGVAAIYGMAPRDLAIVFVHGSTQAGSTIEISAAVQRMTDGADGNVRDAAYKIVSVAVTLSWSWILSGHWS